MPSRASGTSVVLASVYCRRCPSHAFSTICRIFSGAPIAYISGQSLQFSIASSGPSSPPHRSTHSRNPRSSKYFLKNSSQAAVFALSSSRSKSAQAGGDMGVSMRIVGSAAPLVRRNAATISVVTDNKRSGEVVVMVMVVHPLGLLAVQGNPWRAVRKEAPRRIDVTAYFVLGTRYWVPRLACYNRSRHEKLSILVPRLCLGT